VITSYSTATDKSTQTSKCLDQCISTVYNANAPFPVKTGYAFVCI